MKYVKPQINCVESALISVQADPLTKGPSGSDAEGSNVLHTITAYQADE